MYPWNELLIHFYLLDPCSNNQCKEIENGSFICKAESWESFDCLYECEEGYYLIDEPEKQCVDPCLSMPCGSVGNATYDRCEPLNATSKECFYNCNDGYHPINDDPSQGCLG